DLASSLAGTAYSFTATDQAGLLLSGQFVTPVELAIPYPSSLSAANSLRAYRLENDQWVEVVDRSPNTIQQVLTIQADQFGTYRLTRVLEHPWDVNEDNVVDIFDLVLVGMNFMKSGAVVTGDVNLDSTVDLFDLVLVAKHFGETYGVVTAAAPTVLAGQAQVWVSMSARHSTSRNGGLQRQLLELEVEADMQTPIAGYQLDVTYDPRLLTVVGFEKGDILGEGSFSLDPRMTPGRIANIAGTQLGESSVSGLGRSTVAKVSFRLKGDVNLALKSIGIGNLVVADQQALPVPFEIDPSITADLESVVEERFGLGQNYPNPFNPETWIPYQLASSEAVLVQIYDASGHLVRQIDVGFRSAGSYTSRAKSVYWDGRNEFGEQVASGVYYYTIHAGDFSATSKMLLLK
ncbi:TPA: T9SS type A sorting domain-containing protein, partial [Candidatus Poribacteria bacterium]|nr:T9SS type A sorting domain-containing protein [Candidatus Poribacteria bacterium]